MTNLDKKVAELFEAGCHLGHKKNRVYPKAKKYIYSIENGVSVIDLTMTVPLLEKAKEFVSQLGKEGKTLLVVASKRISSTLISDLCQASQVNHVTVKWPAGLITNFEMISKNAKKLLDMKDQKEKGEWSKYVKHEQVELQKELNKLEKFYGGIAGLKKLPDAIFVIDIKKEKNSVIEAKDCGIPVVAVVDTNVNPDLVDYPIPGNDDSLSSIEYFAKEIIGAYTSNKLSPKTK
jgi:small subunit ribosomal protein S2